MGPVYAMWLRQIKKSWRSKPRMIGSLGQPLLFLLALGFGFGPIFEKAGSGGYMQFLAPGVIAMTILFTAMFSGIELIWDKQFGFLKETLVSPSSRLSIFLGRTLGGATVAFLQGLLVFGITLLMGFRPMNWFVVPVVFLFMFMTAVLFTALGTAIASKMDDMQAFPLIMNFVMMPLFFLSGSLFPLESAPRTLQLIASVNPLAFSVDAIRQLLSGVAHFSIVTDAAVIVVLVVGIMLLGVRLFSKLEV